MKIGDLLDLTLREILEKYCIVQSLECGYVYGVALSDDVERIFEEFNVEEEYPEAFDVDDVVCADVVIGFDDDLLGYDRLVEIVEDNLGVSRK